MCSLHTIRYTVVPNVTNASNNLTEEKVLDNCFDLLFAFDEVITAGGYREPITLQQIKTNMEMESHDEKIHNMIKISKMESAKDQARDAAKVIREKQREQQKVNAAMGVESKDAYGSGRNVPFAEQDEIKPYQARPDQTGPYIRFFIFG